MLSGLARHLDEGGLSSALLPKRFDLEPSRLDEELSRCLAEAIRLRRDDPSIGRWLTFPLLSRTGDATDYDARPYVGQPQATEHFRRLPLLAEIIGDVRRDGFDVDNARVAVITGRGMLRPHVDNYVSIRLIVPLTEQGTDFRHLLHDRCVAMRRGELWSIRPQTCHGAANVASHGNRIALLVDARPHSTVLPAWYPEDAGISPERLLELPVWNDRGRSQVESRARRRLDVDPLATERQPMLPVEEEWLFAPFEYDLSAAAAYDELAAFLDRHADECTDEPTRTFWAARAGHWRANNCVGAPTD